MAHNKIEGEQAEHFLEHTLINNKIQYHKEGKTWYDFLVMTKHKLEVKSCILSVKTNKKPIRYMSGRFDFTSPDNRELQHKENIWVCFILRHYNSFLILGFTKAKNLNKQRYIPLYKLRELGIISLTEWLKTIKLGEC